MRLSAAAVVLGVLGALGGGALVGRWCLGLVLIALSVGSIAWGLFVDDDGQARPGVVPQVTTLDAVLDRSRRSG